MPLLSVLVGPVWRLVNPIRALHRLLSWALGTAPEDGLAPYPRRLGYWPAAGVLLAFVWLELVCPGEHDAADPAHRYFAAYLARAPARGHLLGLALVRPRRRLRGVLPPGRAPVAARAAATTAGWCCEIPLNGVAGTPVAPGLFAVVGVLLGSTAYDSFSNSPWWVVKVQESSLDPRLLGTLALVAAVVLVTGLFVVAAALSGRAAGLSPGRGRPASSGTRSSRSSWATSSRTTGRCSC